MLIYLLGSPKCVQEVCNSRPSCSEVQQSTQGCSATWVVQCSGASKALPGEAEFPPRWHLLMFGGPCGARDWIGVAAYKACSLISVLFLLLPHFLTLPFLHSYTSHIISLLLRCTKTQGPLPSFECLASPWVLYAFHPLPVLFLLLCGHRYPPHFSLNDKVIFLSLWLTLTTQHL